VRREGAEREVAVVEGAAFGVAVECGADAGLRRARKGCPVGVEGGPAWGEVEGGDLRETR